MNDISTTLVNYSFSFFKTLIVILLLFLVVYKFSQETAIIIVKALVKFLGGTYVEWN